MFTGVVLATAGAALAAGLSGCGGALGMRSAGEAAAGVLAEDPEKFSKALILQLMPGMQCVYGLVVAFLIAINAGLFSGGHNLTQANGWQFLFAAAPVALAGLICGIAQGRCAAAGIRALGKHTQITGKAILINVTIETYALFSLAASVLLVLGVQVG